MRALRSLSLALAFSVFLAIRQPPADLLNEAETDVLQNGKCEKEIEGGCHCLLGVEHCLSAASLLWSVSWLLPSTYRFSLVLVACDRASEHYSDLKVVGYARVEERSALACTLVSMVNEDEFMMDRNGRTSRFKRICVFCGSSAGKKTLYRSVALELGNEMVRRKIDLVYGGGSVGLMGEISHTVHNGGGHVLGVIPKALMPQEITGESVGEVRAVSDMHERKAEMARQSDAFIALPGGYGTLEELLEMITWVQLGIHDKPVGLLNVDGYYNSLLALLDKAVEEGFLKVCSRNILLSAPTARELLDKFEEYEPTHERVTLKSSWDVDSRDLQRREIEQLGYGGTPQLNC